MIRRARRDGREARENEVREKREDEKGTIFSSSPQGMTSWSSSIKFGFFKLIECIIKKKICHGVKQNAKICAIGEQNVIN